MLAFNLGVFFRNLKGEEVRFAAENGQCRVGFTGDVQGLHEVTELTRRLTVELGRGPLRCRIEIEEDEEEGDEESENPEVHVCIRHGEGAEEAAVVETTFRFDEVRFQPASAQPVPEDATVN